MRKNISLLYLLVLIITAASCKKTDNKNNHCFEADITFRQIVNKQATVKLINNNFYLIELGTIDTRLNPCYLAPEFKVNDLQVVISGDVKATVQMPGEPCCTENFVLTKIM